MSLSKANVKCGFTTNLFNVFLQTQLNAQWIGYFLDGRRETVMFDKITSRIQKLCYGLNLDYIDPVSINNKAPNLI